MGVYGAAHLVGADDYWTMPQMDERMALVGYRYFLHEPWQWPVFVSHRIDVPYATSVAFNDCIPIWALVNKLLATVVPRWATFSADAFLGLWHALVYVLQACFGVACLRALGHRSWRAAIVTALFVLATPAWIARYGHPALSAHFIELWAIWLYLLTPVRAPLPRRLGCAHVVQLVLAALITPYHPALSVGVFVASILRSRDRRSIAIWLPLGFVAVAGATWFAGYFGGEGAVAQWGFEKQSTNLLSWLVPVRSGIVGDATWLVNVRGTDWQWEGYAYLGIGCLAMIALLVMHGANLRRVIRRHAVLFAVAMVCFGFALSNHVYLGSHEIAVYKVPRALRWIAEQFRAPGRFVWVPMYLVMIFVLHRTLARYATRRFFVVVLLVAIQWIDVRADWAFQRAWTDGPRARVLEPAAWRALIHAHTGVAIHPTYACIGGDQPAWAFELASGVQLFASERALQINGTYNARTRRVCADEEARWPSLTLEPNVLVVLLPQAVAIAASLERAGAVCESFLGARVCSTRGAALASARAAGVLGVSP